MGLSRRAALSLVPLLLIGCAARKPVAPPPEPAFEPPAVEQPPAPDFGPLYREVDRGLSEYRSGIELLAGGDETAGERKIAAAAALLAGAAERCRPEPGCDMGRVVGAHQELLALHTLELNRQTFAIRSLEQSIEAFEEREPGTVAYHAGIPEISRTTSLLRGTDLRELIADNGAVRAALDDWLTWMRPMLIEAHEQYRFLRAEIAPVYEEAGLPEALLFAMLATESGGKVHAFSRAGAAGPLQFMRYTGRKYGLRVVDGFDQRLDPVAATRANVAYLNDRFQELNDDLEKALAAYNGGEGRMRTLHRRHEGAPLWDKRVFYALPRETREYVPRILAAALLFLHPERFGLEFVQRDVEVAELTLEREAALGEIAVCLGQALERPNGWFRTLRNLNPRLEPGDRVAAGETIRFPSALLDPYRERCLDTPLTELAAELHAANYPDGPQFEPYVVRPGDTLGRIASRHRCTSLGEIAAVNRIRGPRYVIQVGQELKIPTCG